MQLLKMGVTSDRRPSSLLLPMVEKSRPKQPTGPLPLLVGFARQLNVWIDKGGMSNVDVGALIGYKNGEMVRRYRLGRTMPRPDKLTKLAKQMRMKPIDLLFPEEAKERSLTGMLGESAVELSPDEQRLIKAYRKLPPPAQKALRANCVGLLEEHGPKGVENPWGKGTQ